nr:aminotransferase class V-fold PLP-dependent enzyme [Saprospiraceae bacterium]
MLSSQDITKIRKDTPGCSDKLFFNSAGSSLPVREVVDRQINYLQEEALFGGYKTMAKYASEAAEAYVEAAKLLGCEPHQVAFCESATVAYYRVISTMRFEMGDVILTSELDYISNFIVFDQLRRKHNISLAFLKKDVDGSFDLEAVRKQFTELHPKMVAVTHVPTSSGVVQDVIAIGKLCNEFEVLYLVDGCQSVGQLEVDVKAIGCDFLSCTGRKFLRGPRGTGFLYVSDRALTMNLVPISADGDTTIWQSADEFEYGNTAKKFETFERSYSNLLGFGAALKYLNGVGIKNIEAYN